MYYQPLAQISSAEPFPLGEGCKFSSQIFNGNKLWLTNTHNQTYLLLIAWSSAHGKLVAPSTRMPLLSTPTPNEKVTINEM